ncbi:helix-turn-helix transcriptional regulator [bacterium]|nr:helix-turn-helix transcriptional regulator [bacterium]
MTEELSLAEYIIGLREKIGLSASGLAKKTAIPLAQIEDIEAGKDLFLPATIRQKLAKGLKVNPADIKEHERIMLDKYDSISESYISQVKKAILEGETDNLRCPICSSKLVTRIAKLVDLENNIALHPKAQCSKCSFQIK